MDLNKCVSGQRWKCCHCELFLSHQDLEYCPLTEMALKRFGDKMTPGQHMVEFRSDKTMDLLKPVRSRQERDMAKSANSARSIRQTGLRGQGANDVVELLDSDGE